MRSYPLELLPLSLGENEALIPPYILSVHLCPRAAANGNPKARWFRAGTCASGSCCCGQFLFSYDDDKHGDRIIWAQVCRQLGAAAAACVLLLPCFITYQQRVTPFVLHLAVAARILAVEQTKVKWTQEPKYIAGLVLSVLVSLPDRVVPGKIARVCVLPCKIKNLAICTEYLPFRAAAG